MKIGFIGAGTIAKSAVVGFCAADCTISEIWLSPRNADTSAELERTYANVTVADSNQSVVDKCEVIILSVRPQIAKEVIAELEFRPEQRVISLVAGFSHAILAPLLSPVRDIVRAAPLPSVAMRLGPTAIYPPDAVARSLFGKTGTAVEVTTESEFDALLAVTAEMASFFALLGTCSKWLIRNGVAEPSASRFVAAMFEGLAATAANETNLSFQALVQDHMTKGGLNEQLYREISQSRVFDEHERVLGEILSRVRGAT
jgi:pyrroline-5-carboxylate reductase